MAGGRSWRRGPLHPGGGDADGGGWRERAPIWAGVQIWEGERPLGGPLGGRAVVAPGLPHTGGGDADVGSWRICGNYTFLLASG